MFKLFPALLGDQQEGRAAQLARTELVFGETLSARKVRDAAASSRTRGAQAMDALQPRQNRLLGLLPAAERESMIAHMQLVSLTSGQILYEPGDAVRYAYFPTDCLVSLVYLMESGASNEVGIVGNEGVVGTTLFMGGETFTHRAMVNGAGFAYRLRGPVLMDYFDRSASMRRVLLRYTQALFSQTAQIAICNRRHTVDQQLCCRLLLCLDRLQSNELAMTQELIAEMLGVRRSGVTEAASRLRRAGLIGYRRGSIVVRDRARLEDATCECYGILTKEYDRLLTVKGAITRTAMPSYAKRGMPVKSSVVAQSVVGAP